MFRTVARSIAVLAVLVPLVASARTVPPGVNLHNGYLVIINDVKYEDGFFASGLVRVDEKDEAHVTSASSVVVNRCCIVAGWRYVVELNYVDRVGIREPVFVTPRLCNIRGIPFGYAVVVYSGIIKKSRAGSGGGPYESVDLKGRQAHEDCPTES